VARTALEVNHDDVFRLPPSWRARGVGRRFGGRGLGAQQVVEGHADQAAAADAEHVATGQAEVAVTEVFAEGTGKSKHGGSVVEEEFR
jgi:hypothetical protein